MNSTSGVLASVHVSMLLRGSLTVNDEHMGSHMPSGVEVISNASGSKIEGEGVYFVTYVQQ